MNATLRQERRITAIAVAIAVAFACLLTPHLVRNTMAAFLDNESGRFGPMQFEIPEPSPMIATKRNSYLGATFVALSDTGHAAYVWGYRGTGMSGTGQETVDATSAVSVVKLEGDRKMVTITGGTTMATAPDTMGAIGVLASDGTVWTWGNAATPARLGRAIVNGDNSKPKQVIFPDLGGAKVIDLQSGAKVFVALTDTGDVYTWGHYFDDNSSTPGKAEGDLGQGPKAESSRPRKILTGIHSIGTGVQNSWAIASDKWSVLIYAEGMDSKAAPQEFPGKDGATVLFWGRDHTHFGSASGDPALKDQIHPSPVPVAKTAGLNKLLQDGTKAGDDNTSLGKALGSTEDKGTFRQLGGISYGSYALLKDGSVYAWGNPTYGGSGGAATVDRPGDTPMKVSLPDPTNGYQQATIKQVVSVRKLVFMLDTTGTVWMYGYLYRAERELFPKADGTTPAASSNTAIGNPIRIAGAPGTGWAAGEITGLGSPGEMTLMVTHADGSVWLAGGGNARTPTNTRALVRNHWKDNTVPTTAAVPITKTDLSSLPK
ncbi:MAG: hypothetical protein LBH68_05205 [Bifidobacteriaceae bacterium]|jgi:alpha-tubulin suppressor-like RCC1 family protein|nr:hypothetical protein [Bifidobacteriaceae bacterium]